MSEYTGYIDEINTGSVKGWCVGAASDFQVRLHVSQDGKVVASGVADKFRPDLAAAGIGTGHHGFEIDVPGLRFGDFVEVYPDGMMTSLVMSTPSSQLYEVMRGQTIVQCFTSSQDWLSAVSLQVAFAARGSTSSLLFAIYVHNECDDELVIEKEIPIDSLRSTDWVDIFFRPIPKSHGKKITIAISSRDASGYNCARFRLTESNPRIKGHQSCHVNGIDKSGYGLIANLGYSPPLSENPVPPVLNFSPVTQCNFNCVHCITRSTRKSLNRMSDKVRDEIAFWCRKGAIKYIITDYSGDILWADERFGGELDFLIGLDVSFQVNTNGECLSVARGQRLLNSKMDYLSVSLDAARPETFKRIRRGSPPLNSVLENVAEFARVRQQMGLERSIRLALSFVMMRCNIEELPQFVEIAAELGVDSIQCSHLEAYTKDMVEESLWYHKELFAQVRSAALDVAEKRGVALNVPLPIDERVAGFGHTFCSTPWNGAVITGSGEVIACCHPKTRIGNLNEQSLEEIWNGQRYQAFRLAVNSDKSPLVCDSCPKLPRPGNRLSFVPYETVDQWVMPE